MYWRQVVSQSPVDDLSEAASLRYKQGWRALNRLLHEDRAFSGKEKNCAFLNCGGERASFATVSAVAGFDFPDDGRGLATVDWDFDGDLDVWLTNRTAPRLRFLANGCVTRPFVAIKLRGDGRQSNRDAIGARLELHVRGARQHPVRIRTLRCGEGFLSQSSNWMHFGLGEATGIEKVVVRWPGGRPEEIRDLQPGHFYHVTQGEAAARRFLPPAARVPLESSVPTLPSPGDAARIVVPPGLPLPLLSLAAAEDSPRSWQPADGRPTLINLWATWCAPCLTELAAWGADRDKLTAAGVDVILFNTDALGPEETFDPEAIAAILRKTGAPFPSFRIAPAGLHALDHLNRAVLDLWQPLPLPTSFLIDARGELAVIYKGPVTVARVLEDLKIAQADATARRAAATPFPGRWFDASANAADPKRVASLMLDHDEAAAAIAYLDRCVDLLSRRPDNPPDPRHLADMHYMSGVLKRDTANGQSAAIASLSAARDLNPSDFRVRRELAQALFAAGRGDEAAAELLAATRINPSDLDVKNELADLNLRLDRPDQARSLLEEILAATPKDGLTRFRLADVLAQTGDARSAIQHYRQSLADAPRLLDAANALARLLATHPDAAVRSAEEALALAERLCTITQQKDARYLDTLGLALANKGEFDRAVEAARTAVALVPETDTAGRDAIRKRIESYQRREPVRF